MTISDICETVSRGSLRIFETSSSQWSISSNDTKPQDPIRYCSDTTTNPMRYIERFTPQPLTPASNVAEPKTNHKPKNHDKSRCAYKAN